MATKRKGPDLPTVKLKMGLGRAVLTPLFEAGQMGLLRTGNKGLAQDCREWYETLKDAQASTSLYFEMEETLAEVKDQRKYNGINNATEATLQRYEAQLDRDRLAFETEQKDIKKQIAKRRNLLKKRNVNYEGEYAS